MNQERQTKRTSYLIQELKIKNTKPEELIIQQKEEFANVIDVNKKFISVLVHDLWSPFNTILNSLDILKDELNAPVMLGYQYTLIMLLALPALP
jgi:signal transduction histidine kinase